VATDDLLPVLQGLVLSGWRFWTEHGRLQFRAPGHAVDDELLARLRARKAEILGLLDKTPERLEICPLSYGQQALWFLWKLAPGSHAYHLSLPIRLAAATPQQPWRHACDRLLARHPQLRTTFSWRGKEPIQHVHPPGPVDWREIAVDGRDRESLASAMSAEHRRPFDLERGPVLRARWLVRESDATLLLTCHHIVSDAWSHAVMLRELEVLAAGGDVGPAPAATYHDFVWWQRALVEGDAGQRLWEYWRRRLAPPLPVLELPYDRPRPQVQSFNGGSASADVPQKLAHRLQRLGAQAGVTLSSALLAAFALLLMRTGGQRELLVGMPLLGRPRAEHAHVVGYFVDPVVIRLRFAAGQTFHAFLGDVHRTVLEALEHSRLPFALLVGRLAPARDPGRSPLFDVMFNHLTHTGHRQDRLEIVGLDQVEGQFDLGLTANENGDRVRLALGYNKDLFLHTTASRMLADLARLLEDVADDPHRPLLADAAVREPRVEEPRAVPRTVVAPAAPLTAVETQLAAIWRELLGIEHVARDDDFFERGGHSLLTVHLSAQIEEAFGVALTVAQMLRTRTLADLASAIEAARPEHRETPDILVPLRATGTRRPIVMIPGAGGNILYLEPLARRLGPGQPVWGLQALGFGKSAAIPERVEDMAERYVELLRAEPRLAGPVALVGHSFGGLVAFEIARRLQALDPHAPLQLAILDLAAPEGLPAERIRGWDDAAWLDHVAMRMEKIFGIDLALDAPASQNERIEAMVERMIAARLLPAGTHARHFARFVEVYRSNSLSSIRYAPGVLEAPARVTVFKATEEDPDLQSQLREPGAVDERTLGWDRHAALPVEVVEVGGTHLTMMTEPFVGELAARLSGILDRGR
jgi:thioesterase domain-containing protein/acyl carrier protein